MLPPRSLVAPILGITVVPLVAMVWLGWRVLDQDRILEREEARQRLENSAEIAISALQRGIAASEQRLSAGTAGWPAGAVTFIVRDGAVEAEPRERVAYLPAVSPLRGAPAATFSEGEDLEFRGDRPDAIRVYRELVRAQDAGIRAGALLRLARALKNDGKSEDALAVYGQLAVMDGVQAGSAPAGLVGRYARCKIFEENRREAELNAEAARLEGELRGGRWLLTAPVYWLYTQDAVRWTREPASVPREAEVFGDAASVLQANWDRFHGTGRQIWTVDGRMMTVLWQRPGDSLRVLVAGPEFVQSQWLLAVKQLPVRLALRGADGRPALGEEAAGPKVVRSAADTDLPWTIAAMPAGSDGLDHRLFCGGGCCWPASGFCSRWHWRLLTRCFAR